MLSFLLLLRLASLSFAAVHTVQVGQDGLTFTPDAIAANPGDQVVFTFNPKNHSVTQSSFASPCGLKPGGFNSGFMPVQANQTTNLPTFTITVNDTSPIWVFCDQAANTPSSHCGQGMVFAVNCGQTGTANSFDNFQKAALAVGAALNAGSTTAAGGVTIPAAPTATLVTQAVSVSTSTWTTTYSSYPGSPAPTPASLEGNVIVVQVGANGTTFNPPHVSASPRDTISFQFYPKNHTVTQSSFDAPCQHLNANGTAGFDSGFQPVTDTNSLVTVNFTVNETGPTWFYCRQTGHCGMGMVFAINSVEDSPRNFSAFQALAMTLNGTSSTSSSNTTGTSPAATTSAPGSSALKSTASVGMLALMLSISVFLL